jgi:hypothetical protein
VKHAEIQGEEQGDDPQEGKPHPERLAEPKQGQEFHIQTLCL